MREILLEQFINLQNRPAGLQSEFQGLAADAPEAFFATIDAQIATIEPERIDAWLIGALRRAYRAGAGLARFREWIASAPVAGHFRNVSKEFTSRAYRRELIVARSVAGLPLAPLAAHLMDWALIAVDRINESGSSAKAAPAPHSGGAPDDLGSPLARAPLAWLIRFNDADPETVEAEIEKLVVEATSEASNDRVKAASLILSIIASPSATKSAARLWPRVLRLVDPVVDTTCPPIYVAVDPNTPSDEVERLARATDPPRGLVDPRSPAGEEQLVLAARCDGQAYTTLARAGLCALGESGSKSGPFDDPYESLETFATCAPSIFNYGRQGDARFVAALLRLACDPTFVDLVDRPARSGRELLKTLDLVLEALFATWSVDRYGEMLLAIPWERLPSDHWPTRPYRWRPQLGSRLVEELVVGCAVRMQSGKEEEVIAGSNLLEAVTLHTIDGLSAATVGVLSLLFDPSVGTSLTRRSVCAIAVAANDQGFAQAIYESRWMARTEGDRDVAVAASHLLCREMAGRVPIADLADRVLPGSLAVAAERATDQELDVLAETIAAAIKAAVALSARASTEIDGPAELERDGHIFRMLPFERAGALRMIDRSPSWATACFELLGDELFRSPRNSLCESLGTSLAAGMTGPSDAAADYVERLIRRRATPTRRLGARILQAGIAVATSHPRRRNQLLELLVLSTNDDEGLARLASAAWSRGSESLSMLVSYVQSLLQSGRAKRTAYGLTLAGLTAHLSPAMRGARSAKQWQGFLGKVDRSAALIEASHDAASYWAGLRLASGDPAAEFLALSIASWPLASASFLSEDNPSEPMLDKLFRRRLRERSAQPRSDGLFGDIKPPNWLFDRTDMI